MRYNNKPRYPGYFKTLEEAILARDAALKVFKENKPSVVGSDNIDSIVDKAKEAANEAAPQAVVRKKKAAKGNEAANEAVARKKKKKVAPKKKIAPKKKTAKKTTRHGQRCPKHAPTSNYKKICKHPKCTKRGRCRGQLCETHQEGGPKICTYPGCTNQGDRRGQRCRKPSHAL